MLLELPDTLSVLQVSPFAGDVLTGSDAPNAVWHILGQSNDGTELCRTEAITCANEAGQALFRLTQRARVFNLAYQDAFDRTNANEAEAFIDRLAELMWEAIERDGDVPDDPEAYADLADDHPIDALRTGFLEAAGIL